MRAPDFTLPDQHGKKHKLKDYAGKWLVLYFYPKDETPGCTAEACNFRDAREVIAQLSGAEVVGISKDSMDSHKKFAEHHELNFTILSDPDHKVIEAYGAWQPKKFMGKEFLGTQRNTVVINPQGEIVKVYENVDPQAHTGQIIADLKALQAGQAPA
jgi:thioredoxin-dependent peroxiredoxin